jgi:predicted RNA-binding Zn ribbon-like protein
MDLRKPHRERLSSCDGLAGRAIHVNLLERLCTLDIEGCLREQVLEVVSSDPDLIGGHPLLDLINTVSWRLDPARRVEGLQTYPMLLRRLAHIGLLDADTMGHLAVAESDSSAAVRVLKQVCTLREWLFALLSANAEFGAPSPEHFDALHRALVGSLRRATPEPSLPLQWRIAVRQPADLVALVGLAALDLLQSPEVDKVRVCEGPGCGWLFIDRSRSHTRRWCSTSDCGNRMRVKRHYMRQRSGGAR